MVNQSQVWVVLETHWDRKQLAACASAWQDHVQIAFPEPSDVDCPLDLEPVRFVDQTLAQAPASLRGVFSASDYPGATLAAAIAERHGLSGASPEAVLRASHKWYSRIAQREAVPDAVPNFWLIDARRGEVPSELRYPCFVKPVKGAFSVLARRVEDASALEALLQSPAVHEFCAEYMSIFNHMLAAFSKLEIDGGHFIAEELVTGVLVTVEGWVLGDRIEFLGVVDSVVEPRTGSFLRFDYPSRLPAAIQARMCDIAERVVRHLGLDRILFNFEMMWDPDSDRIRIIELNPRLCGQFADLYHKVDGVSGYQVALALALGEEPLRPRAQGRYCVASSMPLRVFEACRARRVPTTDDVGAAEASHPETLIWTECAEDELLASTDADEDGFSHRYAVINAGANDRDELDAKLGEIQARLGYVFEPAV